VGFDYVYVDQQHGVIANTDLVAMFQAIAGAGAAPLTRVPANTDEAIGHALDFGAMGVMVPEVGSRHDAERAVAACRYPPHGVRSHGMLRPAAMRVPSDPSDPDRAACILLVESASGLDALDEIASVDGVDAIMVGPQDLTLGLGLELRGDWQTAPKLMDAVERIRAACERHGIAAGIGTTGGDAARRWLERGFLMVNVGNDLGHMTSALAAHLATARGRT
ncbi:MAG: aldolase, partial [Chloroflexi bacterium]|nr:aldolase [Chloroflexota bacterium]